MIRMVVESLNGFSSLYIFTCQIGRSQIPLKRAQIVAGIGHDNSSDDNEACGKPTKASTILNCESKVKNLVFI